MLPALRGDASKAAACRATSCAYAKPRDPKVPNCPIASRSICRPPAGRFGMVLQVEIVAGRGQLRYIAFGVRHHPPESHAESVCEIAHRRLRD